jgi:hypothetical protein
MTALLDALSPECRELVLALRDVVSRTVPEAEEFLLCGSLPDYRPEVGGRVNGAVCQIVVKRGQPKDPGRWFRHVGRELGTVRLAAGRLHG